MRGDGDTPPRGMKKKGEGSAGSRNGIWKGRRGFAFVRRSTGTTRVK